MPVVHRVDDGALEREPFGAADPQPGEPGVHFVFVPAVAGYAGDDIARLQCQSADTVAEVGRRADLDAVAIEDEVDDVLVAAVRDVQRPVPGLFVKVAEGKVEIAHGCSSGSGTGTGPRGGRFRGGRPFWGWGLLGVGA